MQGEFLLSRGGEGHTSPITSVAIAPNGGPVFSGGYDGKVIRWEARKSVWVFQAPNLINSVGLSPDGGLLSAACADGYAYILNRDTGFLRSALGPHGDDVNVAVWTPAADQIFTGCDERDHVIRLWSVSDQCVTREFHGHQSGVPSISLSPDMSAFASAAEDGTCRIWNTADGKTRAILEHPSDPEAVSWSQCGKYIATGCNDGTLRLWCATQFYEIARWQTTAAVRSVCFRPDSSAVVAGSYNGTVNVLRIPDLQPVARNQSAFQWERGLAASADTIVVGSFGESPIIVDGTEQPIGRTLGINSICLGDITDSLDAIYVASDSGSVYGIPSRTETRCFDTILNCVTVRADGAFAVCGSYRGDIGLLDLKNQMLKRAKIEGGPVNCVAWLSDQNFVAGSYDGMLRTIASDLTVRGALRAHTSPIKSLATDGPRELVVTGCSDGTIKVWQGDSCLTSIAHPDLVLVNSIAVQSKRGLIASASRDARVRLWSIEDGRLISELPRIHFRSVKAVAIHSSEKIVCSGSYDGRAVLWRQTADANWESKVLLSEDLPGVPAVAVGEDFIVAATWTGRIYVWSLTGELVESYQLNA